MNMRGTKRKKRTTEPENIKRWRSEIEGYTGQGEREDKPQKKTVTKLTRKEKRKEGRKLKKMRQDAFRKHKTLPTHESLHGERVARLKQFEKQKKRREKRKRNKENKRLKLEAEKEEEEAKQKVLDEESAKDDKIIKDLEKQMKMNKRKSKTLPQSFQNDGLDFILNVVGSENLKGVLDEEEDDDLTGPLLDSGSDSDDNGEDENMELDEDADDSDYDTEAVTPEVTGTSTDNVKGILKKEDKSESDKKKVKFGEGTTEDAPKKVPKKKEDILNFIKESIAEVKEKKKKKKKVKVQLEKEEDSDDDMDEENEQEDGSDMEDDGDSLLGSESESGDEEEEEEEDDEEDEKREEDDEEDEEESEDESQRLKDKSKKLFKNDSDDDDDDKNSDSNEDESDDEGDESDEEVNQSKTKKPTKKESEYKEDIYGRLVDEKGNLVNAQKSTGAYVPPGKRLQMASSQDEKKKLEMERLKKQLKGLINRLSESNLQPISSQIEDMFRTRSRAELSESLTAIIMEACVAPTIIPERLISEQMMLLAILQGNVGNEVGAVFLQSLVEQFSSRYEQGDTEGKEIDNMLVMLASMYNFKMFHCALIFDILKKFTDTFQERDIELLLVVLKNVGFSLRKDDPTMLKEVIVKVQEKAGSVDTSKFKDESRVKFMLEVLMAIRNNNMRKIPNYDPTHIEHLRKVLRNYTKGSTTSETQLKISLEDLLNADAQGRWWLVGSAWTGRQTERTEVEAQTESSVTNIFSDKILELARQQRMNTDIRRNIFCIIMTSEDFADAFEKLLRLNLKNQQEREIMHVIIDVSLQEKKPNPFYAYLAQKFCEFHRRFQMTVQFNFWDRLKILSELTTANINNLAAFMIHLIVTKAISLSVFKVVEFSELDKHKLHLIRTILRALLMDHPEHIVTDVFSRVASLPKLSALREALRVFMRHFLLRRVKDQTERAALEEHIELAERALGSSEGSKDFD